MDLGLKGRVAMVAAASKGLGRAIATSLAREGCAVSISARNPESLEEAREGIARSTEARVVAEICDVSKLEDLQRWHARTVESIGPVDILVTNTGGPPAERFMALTEDQWQSGVDSTLMNVVRLSRLVIPDMQKKKWGRVIHITSLVAKQPVDLLTISSTLRAGLSGLTKTMSNQLASDNILVNAVLPGHFWTDRQVHLAEIRAREEGISVEQYAEQAKSAIPLQRYGRPEELGDVVAFLCSEKASYISGVSLQVDGGLIKGTM